MLLVHVQCNGREDWRYTSLLRCHAQQVANSLLHYASRLQVVAKGTRCQIEVLVPPQYQTENQNQNGFPTSSEVEHESLQKEVYCPPQEGSRSNRCFCVGNWDSFPNCSPAKCRWHLGFKPASAMDDYFLGSLRSCSGLLQHLALWKTQQELFQSKADGERKTGTSLT